MMCLWFVVVLGEEQMEMEVLNDLVVVKCGCCDCCELCVLMAMVWPCIYTDLMISMLVTPG